MNKPVIRFILDILVFISVLTLPWWFSAVVLAALTIYFPLYLEVLLFGFLFDTLYASQYAFPYTGLLVALGFLVLVLFVRTRIRT